MKVYLSISIIALKGEKMINDEMLKPFDKILVVITNQYMLSQVIWYHSQYPAGIWEAVIILFNENNRELLNIMHKRCMDCGIFSKIYIYEHQNNYLQKAVLLFGYILQFIFNKRDEYDRKLTKRIIGTTEYEKLIIHTRNNRIEIALLNSMRDKICICMEDGLGDYVAETKRIRIHYLSDIFPFILAKMNIMSVIGFDKQFCLKYDNRMIKYSSLPDKMKYRRYKAIKQLFGGEVITANVSDKVSDDFDRNRYDVIVFSSPFDKTDHSEQVYSILHKYLKENYSDKRILIKPHPREMYRFDWNEPDIDVGYLDIAGEEVLDHFPCAEVLLAGTSTLLIKVCKTQRNFKVIVFECIKSKKFRKHIELDSQLMELSEDKFIYL